MSAKLSLLTLSAGLGAFLACVDGGVGAPCSTDADCDGDMICDVHDGQGTCQEDHGHGDAHEVDCAAEDRSDAYAVGLQASGDTFTATFVSADPAPPSLDDNRWVLAITDAGGAPVDGLELVVTPWMPDHDHGTPVEVVVTPTQNPGEYGLDPVNMFMAGLWEVTLEISGAQAQDSITFAFCVE